VHVSVPAARKALRSPASPSTVPSTVSGYSIPPGSAGLPVTHLSRAVVDSWGLALGAGGRIRDVETARAAVITTIRERQVKPAELRADVAARPALPGRADLLDLVTKVEGGSHSELEIWGVDHVLTGPGMPRFVRQFPVALPYVHLRLDAAMPELAWRSSSTAPLSTAIQPRGSGTSGGTSRWRRWGGWCSVSATAGSRRSRTHAGGRS
jgi:hypothetical protein